MHKLLKQVPSSRITQPAPVHNTRAVARFQPPLVPPPPIRWSCARNDLYEHVGQPFQRPVLCRCLISLSPASLDSRSCLLTVRKLKLRLLPVRRTQITSQTTLHQLMFSLLSPRGLHAELHCALTRESVTSSSSVLWIWRRKGVLRH